MVAGQHTSTLHPQTTAIKSDPILFGKLSFLESDDTNSTKIETEWHEVD